MRIKRRLAALWTPALLLASAAASFGRQGDGWETVFEKSGYVATPRYAETMEYCRRLASASPWIRVAGFGTSPEGRELPLVIAASGGEFDPAAASRSGKAVILIQNGIHAGEIDGKDACLMLLRDMAVRKTKAELLEHAVVLVIPIYNVDGHERFGKYNRINQAGPEEMGWRVTGQNLNLNRDYMKADAPETQAWLRLFTSWLPDFLVDCHVTDGADYQFVVTYALEMHENLAAPVRAWLAGTYVPMLKELKAAGEPLAPYLFLRDDKEPSKGLSAGAAPPRFSTSYAALQNRPALLIETHMMKEYRKRVEGTEQLLEATLRLVNREHAALRAAVRAADESTVRGVENPYPLVLSLVDAPNQTFHYLGFRHTVERSDISGADRIMYSREPFEADLPRYDSVVAKVSVSPPAAYLIPKQWDIVTRRLQLHGVELRRLTEPREIAVESYRFTDASWQEKPFEGRHPVRYSVRREPETKMFPAGTIVVPLGQRAARVAIHALEPEAPDALAAWGFFDAVFEQKEYAEDYVMESVAREMIGRDPALKREFDEKVRSDTAFAASPSARLNFFYKKSPYWDRRMNLYPVSRVVSDVSLPTEPVGR